MMKLSTSPHSDQRKVEAAVPPLHALDLVPAIETPEVARAVAAAENQTNAPTSSLV